MPRRENTGGYRRRHELYAISKCEPRFEESILRRLSYPTLREAWWQHWSILFPNAPALDVALADAIRAHLVNLTTPGNLRFDNGPGNREVASWESGMTISADKSGATMRLGDDTFQSSFLPSLSRQGSSPQWNPSHQDHRHPLRQYLEKPAGRTALQTDCQKLLSYAAQTAMDGVLRELTFKIRIGHLEAIGIWSTTDEKVTGIECVKLLNEGGSLDSFNSTIQPHWVGPFIKKVHVKRGPFIDRPKSRLRKLEAYDIALLEKMRALIKSGEEISAAKAAARVAPLSIYYRDISSAVRRLKKGYSTKYRRVPITIV